MAPRPRADPDDSSYLADAPGVTASLLEDRIVDPRRASRVVRLQPDLIVRDSVRRIE